MASPFDGSDDLPVYVISVAAQLSGMHPQTLREYERRGLVSPGRSGGGSDPGLVPVRRTRVTAWEVPAAGPATGATGQPRGDNK